MKNMVRRLIYAVPPLGRVYRRLRDRGWNRVPAQCEEGFSLYAPPLVLRLDRAERACFAAEARRADVCIDVGAHVGYFTCIACHAGTPTLAIEPCRDNLAVLKRNIALNEFANVEVWPVALGAKPGLAPIYGYSNIASLFSTWNVAVQTDTVAVSTLDLLLGDRFRGQRLLIKIDVEGFEAEVLAGAGDTLRREPKPVWMLEIFRRHPMTGAVNEKFAGIFATFWRAGYESVEVKDELRPFGADDFDAPGLGANFLFRARQNIAT